MVPKTKARRRPIHPMNHHATKRFPSTFPRLTVYPKSQKASVIRLQKGNRSESPTYPCWPRRQTWRH